MLRLFTVTIILLGIKMLWMLTVLLRWTVVTGTAGKDRTPLDRVIVGWGHSAKTARAIRANEGETTGASRSSAKQIALHSQEIDRDRTLARNDRFKVPRPTHAIAS